MSEKDIIENGFPLYKCTICKTIFIIEEYTVTSKDFIDAFNDLNNNPLMNKECVLHKCMDGCIGVASIVGMMSKDKTKQLESVINKHIRKVNKNTKLC